MTADDLADFLASVRAEAAARLARLDTVDTALLPHGLRAEYEQKVRTQRGAPCPALRTQRRHRPASSISQ